MLCREFSEAALYVKYTVCLFYDGGQVKKHTSCAGNPSLLQHKESRSRHTQCDILYKFNYINLTKNQKWTKPENMNPEKKLVWELEGEWSVFWYNETMFTMFFASQNSRFYFCMLQYEAAMKRNKTVFRRNKSFNWNNHISRLFVHLNTTYYHVLGWYATMQHFQLFVCSWHKLKTNMTTAFFYFWLLFNC